MCPGLGVPSPRETTTDRASDRRTRRATNGAPVTETTAVTWLTQDAYDRLKNEYEYLTGAFQTEIAKKIEAAREEGDLKENGGYHAAKDEQGKMAARARQLRHILE